MDSSRRISLKTKAKASPAIPKKKTGRAVGQGTAPRPLASEVLSGVKSIPRQGKTLFDRVASPVSDAAKGVGSTLTGAAIAGLHKDVDDLENSLKQVELAIARAYERLKKKPKKSNKSFDQFIAGMKVKKAELIIQKILVVAKIGKAQKSGNESRYASYAFSGLEMASSKGRELGLDLSETILIRSTKVPFHQAFSLGVNSYYFPDAISTFFKTYTAKATVTALKKEYSADKELSAVLGFMENRFFIFTDLVELLGYGQSLLFGGHAIGQLSGFAEPLSVESDFLLQQALSGTLALASGAIYRGGYEYSLTRTVKYWRELFVEIDSASTKDKSKNLLALEKEILGDSDGVISSEKLTELVRSRVLLGLLDNDRMAVAHKIFSRLKKEGQGGITSELMKKLGISKSLVSSICQLNANDPEHIELVSKVLIDFFNM